MSDVIEATSQPQPSEAKLSDEGKSGNLTASQVTHQLLQRALKTPVPQPSAEQVALATETASAAPAEALASAPEGSEQTPANPEDAELDTALSQGLDPKLQEKIDKRIGKEVAKRKALEAELADVRAKLTQPAPKPETPVVVTPTADQPLAHITDVESLQKEAQSMKEVKRWAQAQLIRDDLGDGVEVNGKKWSKSELQGAVLNVDRVLEDQIPQRYQFIQARQNAEKQAASLFPWLNDKTSADYIAHQAAYKQYPFLAHLPDAPITIAVQQLGMRELQKQLKAAEDAKKNSPVKSKVSPPASQTASGAAPGAIRETGNSTAAKQLQADIEALKKKGNVTGRDLVSVLARKELSKR